jgi:hypothetical protein
MSAWLSAFRVTAVAGAAFAWASACGSGDTTSSTSHTCFIYYGAGTGAEVPEGGAGCPPGVCDYQSQSGCAANENCFPHYDPKSNSVSATCGQAGNQQSGQPCDSSGQLCARGFICVDGACAKACCGGDSTTCDTGQKCIRQAVAFKTSSGAVIAYDEGLGTCAAVGNCDLLDVKSCAGDAKRPVCRIVDPDGDVACAPSGDRTLGDDCDADHQCGPGQHCAGNADTAVAAIIQTKCVRFCGFGSCNSEPACPDSEGLCVHFTRDPEGVGECTQNWRGPGIELDAGTPKFTDAASDGS